jgi:hypothetical protein
VCELCRRVKPLSLLEIANISQEYRDDPADYLWLCKKCHTWYDNIGKKTSITQL